MANNTFIQIKRSLTTNTPTSLYQGEMAWSNSSQTLYIGNPDGSNTVTAIGTKLNYGTLTANAVLVANSTSGINKVFAANLQVNYIEANGAGNTGTAGWVLFSGGSSLVSEQSLPATSENIRRVIDFIEKQRGGGGTELLPALKRALSDRKSTRLNSSHIPLSRMPSSA